MPVNVIPNVFKGSLVYCFAQPNKNSFDISDKETIIVLQWNEKESSMQNENMFAIWSCIKITGEVSCQ